MDADVLVRGEGEARAMPDSATVRALVEGLGVARDEAYGEAARLAAAVDEVISRHGEAIERSSTAALVVAPTTRWRKGESIRTGWRASRTSVLDVVDLERLGDLIAELSNAGAAISGPYWQLDADNAVHGEARRLAAEDARRRADDYAAALGLKVARVAWVAEPGLRQGDDHDGYRAAGSGRMMLMDASAAADDVIEVTPDEMTIRVNVEVGFSLTA
jgi:uncharacterized protein YggE